MSTEPGMAPPTRPSAELDTVVVAPATPSPRSGPWPQPGDQIAGYTLIRSLGTGGMGQVFLARQEHPRREVALKLIRHGLASPEILARFQLEAEALARLRHEGIARILTAGSVERPEGTVPYLVMEYVEGRPLRAHVAGLNLREKVQLLKAICEAVEHAHQRGVIHRDLKPGNILVTADGQPKILDFGVARVSQLDEPGTQTSQLTVAGVIVGTPAYMSPEQTRTDRDEVDTRSDVYALGVLGYEMLSGRLPYELPADQHGIITTIREQAAVPLGQVCRECRGDLETIIGKALEKERERRYPGAGALAEDLARYLDNRAILARPPSLWYRLSKFARRNPALTGALSLAAVLAVAGVGAVTAFAIREQALRQLAEAETRRALASLNFVRNLLTQANPDRSGSVHVSVREALDVASALVAQAYQQQPDLQVELHGLLGELYLSQGDFDAAQRELDQAIGMARQHMDPGDPRRLSIEATAAYLLMLHGELASAFEAMRQLLPRMQAALPDDALVLLELQLQFAEVRAELGQTEGLDTELSALRQRLGRHDDLQYQLQAIEVDAVRATLARKRGDLDTALELRQQLVDFHRQHQGEDAPKTLMAINDLALVLADRGERQQAAELLRAQIERISQRLGEQHPSTITARQNLGYLLMRIGDFDAARGELVAAQEASAHLPERHPVRLPLASNLSTLAFYEGRVDEALRYAAEAAELAIALRGELHPDSIGMMSQYAVMLAETGDPAAARDWHQRALRAAQRRYGEDHPASLQAQSEYAAFLRDTGELDAALEQFALLLPRVERVVGVRGAQTLMTLYQYSGALQQAGRYAEALPLSGRVYEAANSVLGEMSPVALLAPLRHGRSLLGLGRLDEAEPLLLESLERLQAVGSSPEWQSWVAESLAELHERRQDRAAAEAWRKRAQQLADLRNAQPGKEKGE